jgi:hypothetical protein
VRKVSTTQAREHARPPSPLPLRRLSAATVPMDAVADLLVADPATFASLPLLLASLVFLALPPDARGRAACVCRAWRDALADPALWTRLDMSNVRAFEQRYLATLRSAAARAHGQLFHLELSQREVLQAALLPVLTSNAGSLRELHLHNICATGNDLLTTTVKSLMTATPLLQVLAVKNVHCSWEEAPRVLRAEPPFALLQMRSSLSVHFPGAQGLCGGIQRVGPFAAALADPALQPALSELCVVGADTAQPAVMGALVDAALSRRLRELRMDCCTPPSAAPFARLLAEGSLAVLEFYPSGGSPPLFDAAGAALVADALLVNTKLTTLTLCCAHVCEDIRAAELLLAALAGHLSMREIQIIGEHVAAEDRNAVGAALGALIAADAPALHILNWSSSNLGDAGLAPIVEALALNHHLRNLNVLDNDMSEEFAREHLLPAVQLNTALRALQCESNASGPAAKEAEELVRRRWPHG